MKRLIILFLLLFCNLTFSQNNEKKQIIDQEQLTIFFVKSKKNPNFNSTKTYYWYKFKNIISTEGYYYENPLNGLYIKFYSNNNLKEKGSFCYGLKINKWINWDVNGKIISIENYKKGTKKGNQKYFKEGYISRVEKINFWRNKTIYNDSTIIYNKIFNTRKVSYTSKLIE